jgi:hypothetical protein
MKFTSRLNVFRNWKLLKEPGLAKEKLVPSSIIISKELVLEKLGTCPERF